MSEEKATYNSAVARLRQIIEEIERGELDVDVLSAKVREAGRLIQLCKDKLLKADEEQHRQNTLTTSHAHALSRAPHRNDLNHQQSPL